MSRSGRYVDLGNDMKAANSDAFKVAVNRFCNVADDVYLSNIDKSLGDVQVNNLMDVIAEMDKEADQVHRALQLAR